MKIKIMFYEHDWGYAGTPRSQEKIIESIDKNIFDPYVFYWKDGENLRLNNIINIIGKDRVIPFERSKEKTGWEFGYTPLSTNFGELAKEMKFDIIHFKRSGYYEWPFIERLAPLQIETNVFGKTDSSDFCDKHFCVSNYIRHNDWEVVYNPTTVYKEGNNLRSKLNIPEDAIVCGRIGRPAGYYPMVFRSFTKAYKLCENLYYIIIAPDEPTILHFIDDKNVIMLTPTIDDGFIESFYRTIDIYLHYRFDGETFGNGIAQAMMYGKPVLSHTSIHYNAQVEVIGSGGYVADNGSDHFNYLCKLIEDKSLREKVGSQGKKIALEKYEQEKVVHNIQNFYLKWWYDEGFCNKV